MQLIIEELHKFNSTILEWHLTKLPQRRQKNESTWKAEVHKTSFLQRTRQHICHGPKGINIIT